MGKLKNKKATPTFNRPSIDLGNRVEREWKHIKASFLQEDDIIAGAGLVQAISYAFDTNEVMVTAGEPVRAHFYDKDEEVFAFVRKGN